MDHVVKLWCIPDNLDAAEPDDHPQTVHYPHFSTKAVHHNIVDCVAWYGDLILSKAAQECKIVLWRIEGFAPSEHPPPSRPCTDASTRSTTSAFGGSYQRLLQFDVPETSSFYMRFALSTPAGGRPLLAIGNARGKAFFWDLQSLEEWASPGSDAESPPPGLEGRPAAAAATGKDARAKRGRAGVARPLGKRKADGGAAAARGGELPDGLAVPAEDAHLSAAARGYDAGDPFRVLHSHHAATGRRAEFMARQVAWSGGGAWAVVVGSGGSLAVYRR